MASTNRPLHILAGFIQSILSKGLKEGPHHSFQLLESFKELKVPSLDVVSFFSSLVLSHVQQHTIFPLLNCLLLLI